MGHRRDEVTSRGQGGQGMGAIPRVARIRRNLRCCGGGGAVSGRSLHRWRAIGCAFCRLVDGGQPVTVLVAIVLPGRRGVLCLSGYPEILSCQDPRGWGDGDDQNTDVAHGCLPSLGAGSLAEVIRRSDTCPPSCPPWQWWRALRASHGSRPPKTSTPTRKLRQNGHVGSPPATDQFLPLERPARPSHPP